MNKNLLLLVFFFSFFLKSVSSQNILKVSEPLKPVSHTNLVIGNEWSQSCIQKDIFTYMDGIGRVTWKTFNNSGINIDNVVTPSYNIPDFSNDLGTNSYLKKKNYLAFSRYSTQGAGSNGNAENARNYFWQNIHPEEDGYYYSETQIERSPLSRVEKTLKPGLAWAGSNVGISTQYEYNSSTELIKIWDINYGIGDIPTTTENFATGKLAKQIVIDEKGKKLITYIDNEGKTILKKAQEKDINNGLDENGYDGWLCTFYVYDDLNQLRCIISPKAVKYLQLNNWIFPNSIVFNELCFWNNYDSRGRLIIKHSPNAGEIYAVYDNRDRLVLTQDQNQRNLATKQWSFITYDKLDRTVATGLLQNNSTVQALQSYVTGLNYDEVIVSIYVGNTENVVMHNPVISGCATCNNVVTNTLNYFDTYGYTGSKNYNNNYSFASLDPAVALVFTLDNLTLSKRTQNFSTGSKVRVVKNIADDAIPTASQYLTQTTYYNEKGREIQTLADNAKNGTDYMSTQYDFAGQVLSTCQNNSVPGSGINNYQTITKYSYDKLRRLEYVAIQLGSQPFKKIAGYTYNLLGQVTIKKLAPEFNSGNGIEKLNHSYNIQGWLTGVNKGYATSTQNSQQWDNYFGYYLGYDNRDNVFNAQQVNGSITGVVWKTQGDNTPRKYNYEYDNVNRFTKAGFTEKAEPSQSTWDNIKKDFTVSDIVYDENGNLQQKYVKGILPGTQTPLFIDKLTYGYYKNNVIRSNNNQLRSVLDLSDLTASTNGSTGDFKNENYGIAQNTDYEYDGNGNLIKDNNKKIRTALGAGIEYNFLNRPLKITVEGKSITEFIYDAAGSKIAKKTTNLVSSTSKTIWYMGNYLFEEENSNLTLKEIYHPEGRIKVFTPISNPRITIGGSFTIFGNTQGVYEYFVKDNLQNTRVILTEETHSEYHNSTMETAAAFYEERMFGQVDASGNPAGNNEVVTTRIDKSPQAAGWTSNTSQMVSKLSKYSYQVGPNALLKVMAGDNIGTGVEYFYDQPTNNPVGSNILNNLVTNFVNCINGAASTISLHGVGTAISNNLQTTGGVGSLQEFIQNQNVSGSTTPQAYLNVIFFDENFNFVPQQSTAYRVTASGNGQNIPIQVSQAPKNGYAFVYVSNESVTPVFFDNLELYHTRGRLVEENAYYPYGLKIAAISSKAFDAPKNPYLYQGDYAEFDEESGYNEFDLRDYDAQIGRFVQADPYDQFASPYIGMANDPINNIDEDGGFVGWVGAAIGAVAGGASAYAIAKNNGAKGWGLAAYTVGGSIVGAGLGYATDMTFFNSASQTSSFFGNFRNFYAGVLGMNGVNVKEPGEKIIGRAEGCITNVKTAIDAPNLWGWVSNINLPSFNLPTIARGEQVLINVFFNVNEIVINEELTKKSDINRQISTLQRTLRKDPNAEFTISGGIISGDPTGTVGKPRRKDYKPEDDYSGKSAGDLARDRAEKAREYIQKRIRRKFRDRISTDGRVLKTGSPPKAVGQVN